MIIEVKSVDELKDIIESNQVILIDFYAKWCGPCKALAPIIEDLDKEYCDRLKVIKCDVDELDDDSILLKYNVRSLPTCLVFKNGELVDKFIGLRTLIQFKSYFDEYFK